MDSIDQELKTNAAVKAGNLSMFSLLIAIFAYIGLIVSDPAQRQGADAYRSRH